MSSGRDPIVVGSGVSASEMTELWIYIVQGALSIAVLLAMVGAFHAWSSGKMKLGQFKFLAFRGVLFYLISMVVLSLI